MTFQQIRYFCTVAKLENISESARRHQIPQPAMSKSISGLESKLGVKLFLRYGNSLKLTEEGRDFYRYAQRVITVIDDAVAAVQKQKEKTTITIQINSTRHIFIKFLRKFMREHSTVDFVIDFNHRTESLNRGEQTTSYMFQIGTFMPMNYLDKSVPLMEEPFLLAVNKDSPFAFRDSVSIKELVNEHFISQPDGTYLSRYFFQCCKANGVKPNIRVYCNESKYICDLINSGIGIGMVPACSWADMLSSDVKLVRIQEMETVLIQRLFWDSNRYLTHEAQVFMQELIAFYKGIVVPHY
ncbi:MAG: LysR family transcriptional regulator [Clostridiaceae bacterium]|nr:LysR family transcriptional regulator [Clostridiaceae bacterium]